jgi:exodeoxyribonuclease VII small subunit
MPQEEQPTFEQSLARLQQLVESLEDGQLTLGQSLAAYEEGIKHLKICHAALTETERKIEILSGFNAAGEPVTKPFDDSATETEENVARRSRKTGSDRPEPRRGRTIVRDESDDVDGPRELF